MSDLLRVHPFPPRPLLPVVDRHGLMDPAPAPERAARVAEDLRLCVHVAGGKAEAVARIRWSVSGSVRGIFVEWRTYVS